jgi:hypothetical protein
MSAIKAVSVFAYGLGMNLPLLRSIVGGSNPLAIAPAVLADYCLQFSVSGHLPNLHRSEAGLVEGVLLHLSPAQHERYAAWLLCPAVYVPRNVRVLVSGGVSARPSPARPVRAQTFWCPSQQDGPGSPSIDTLGAIHAGAVRCGLSEPYRKRLLRWRPNDTLALERWGLVA